MNVLSGDRLQGLNEIARMAIERPVEAMCLLAGEEFQHEDLMWIRACIMFEAARNMATENRSSIAPPLQNLMSIASFGKGCLNWFQVPSVFRGHRMESTFLMDG